MERETGDKALSTKPPVQFIYRPFFGWGALPDQYGRVRPADDGEGQPPQDPELTDLPPLRPAWGPRSLSRRILACRQIETSDKSALPSKLGS